MANYESTKSGVIKEIPQDYLSAHRKALADYNQQLISQYGDAVTSKINQGMTFIPQDTPLYYGTGGRLGSQVKTGSSDIVGDTRGQWIWANQDTPNYTLIDPTQYQGQIKYSASTNVGKSPEELTALGIIPPGGFSTQNQSIGSIASAGQTPITSLSTPQFAAEFKQTMGRPPTQEELSGYVAQRKTVSAQDYIGGISGTGATSGVTGMPTGQFTTAPDAEHTLKGYDTNNNYAPVYVKPGEYVPGISLYPKPTDSVTPEKMGSANGMNVPGGGTDTSGLSDALVMGANTSIAEIMKMLTPPETAVDQQQQQLLDNMAGLVGEQAKMASDQLTAEQSAGLPELRQQFADINAEILSKTAEYKVLQTQNQNKPITMNTIIGNDRAIMNAQAADIGLLQARALGLQGQIETAQATVDRAIDLKYSTIQAGLNVYQAQLNALLPELNKQEKTQALAQQLLLDQRQQAINDQKENEKNIQGLMLDYVNAGGQDMEVMSAISNASSVEQAIAIMGSYMPQGALEAPKTTTFGGQVHQWNSTTGQWEALGSAYKTGSGSGTAETDVFKTGLENLADAELEATLQSALDENGDVDTTKLNDKQLIELQRRGYFDETDEPETKGFWSNLYSKVSNAWQTSF